MHEQNTRFGSLEDGEETTTTWRESKLNKVDRQSAVSAPLLYTKISSDTMLHISPDRNKNCVELASGTPSRRPVLSYDGLETGRDREALVPLLVRDNTITPTS